MDLETENRIAAILMKEAAELRRQAQSEGALAYLHRPTVRSRPNSRYLTAAVRGVQQANRAVEVNEMWRLREKQMELDNRVKARNESRGRSFKDISESHRSRHWDSNDMETSASTSMASNKRNAEDCYTIEDEGLRDDEVDKFLHSRTKRGRGAVGSRMDETGPYPSLNSDSQLNASGNPDGELKKPRPVLGPEKPYFLKPRESSDDGDDDNDNDDNDDESSADEKRRVKKTSSSRQHSRKHKSREKKKNREKGKNKKRHRRYHHK